MQNSQCMYAKGKVCLNVACSVCNGKILVSGYFFRSFQVLRARSINLPRVQLGFHSHRPFFALLFQWAWKLVYNPAAVRGNCFALVCHNLRLIAGQIPLLILSRVKALRSFDFSCKGLNQSFGILPKQGLLDPLCRTEGVSQVIWEESVSQTTLNTWSRLFKRYNNNNNNNNNNKPYLHFALTTEASFSLTVSYMQCNKRKTKNTLQVMKCLASK